MKYSILLCKSPLKLCIISVGPRTHKEWCECLIIHCLLINEAWPLIVPAKDLVQPTPNTQRQPVGWSTILNYIFSPNSLIFFNCRLHSDSHNRGEWLFCIIHAILVMYFSLFWKC